MKQTRPVGVTPLRLNRTKLGEQIGEVLMGRIASRELPAGSRLPSERELAETFGVSVPVVRQAIALLVSKNLVHKRQGKGTYVRDDAGEWLAGRAQSRGTLGFVIAYTSGADYFGLLFDAVCRAARAEKWHLQVIYSSEISNQQLLDEALSPSLSGLLWAELAPPYLKVLDKIAGKKPVVTFNHDAVGTPLMSVRTDDRAGSRLAAEHLLALGRRDILFVSNYLGREPHRERAAGYRRALSAARVGKQRPRELILKGYAPTARERESFAKLLGTCSAVYFSSGYLFSALRDELARSGRAIPEDLAVIVFDDFAELANHVPPVSAIRQPLEAMAAQAMAMLTASDQGLTVSEPRRVLAPELVVRASTDPERNQS